jgi:hypothetical protein
MCFNLLPLAKSPPVRSRSTVGKYKEVAPLLHWYHLSTGVRGVTDTLSKLDPLHQPPHSPRVTCRRLRVALNKFSWALWVPRTGGKLIRMLQNCRSWTRPTVLQHVNEFLLSSRNHMLCSNDDATICYAQPDSTGEDVSSSSSHVLYIVHHNQSTFYRVEVPAKD